MLRQRAINGIMRNAPIQGDKTPTLLDGDCQQICLGYTPGIQNPIPNQVTAVTRRFYSKRARPRRPAGETSYSGSIC